MRVLALLLALTPAAASAQEAPRLVAQVGHSAGVEATAFSPDGRYVITGGEDRTARVWDAETGAEVARLAGHTEGVFRVAFLGDGRRAVTASYDGTARVWDVATRRTTRVIETAPFADAAISSDGTRLAVGGDPATVWDTETGTRIATLETGRDEYGPLAFSPDGRVVAMAWEGLAVRAWDAETGDVRITADALDRTAEEPRAAWILPDGRFVVVHRIMGSRVVDLDTGRLVEPAEPYLLDLFGLSLSADGARVAVWRGLDVPWPTAAEPPPGLVGETWPEAWGDAAVVEVWDRGAATPRLRLPLFAQARLSPDGRGLLATAYAESAIWDVDGGGVTAELVGRARQPVVGAFADGGRRLLADGVWDLRQGAWAPLPDADLHLPAAEADRVLIVGVDGTAEVRRFGAEAPLLALDPPYQDAGRPVLAFRPDGARLAEADERIVRLWDVDTGEVSREIGPHAHPVDHVAFSTDGRRLVTRARDPGAPGRMPQATVTVWDADTGDRLGEIRPPGRFGPDVAVSRDGARLATTADDTTHVWDVATATLLGQMPGAPAWLPGPDGPFSPDGRRIFLGTDRPLAAPSPDGRDWETVGVVWDLATGAPGLDVGPFPASLKVGRFSPDSRRLLTVDGDGIQVDREGTARLWDADTGSLLHAFDGYQGAGVESAAFAPDGAAVLTVGLDGTPQLWDAATGAEHAALFAFRDGTWAVVDAEGRYDASGGGDVAGLAWALDTPDGLEAVRLAQLKARYYDPGLLAKHLGFNAEPLRDVAVFRDRGVALYPSVAIAEATPGAVSVRLRNRGGGIGAVEVFVNGTRVVEDARPAGAAAADSLTIAVDLTPFRRLFLTDTLNTVGVVSANAEGSLTSRRRSVSVFVPAARGTDEEAPDAADGYRPHLWAVLAGVGEYVGDALDLRFAGSDAADVAEALGVAAPRLFGAERTHVTLLTTEAGGDALPTRAALLAALDRAAAEADARDVLLVYLAGHGVVHGGADGDFYFLTSEAASGDLADAAVRDAVAVSAAELEDRLAAVPAQKRVLILDTCASGRVVEQLSARRDVPGAQVRSLDRLKDHTGTFVLAGSAADAVSYEASQYGQGLLTWSLLEGMRLAADADDNALDVLAWFDHAQRRVPELARSIGGIQQPELVMPTGRGSYPVGRVLSEDQARIPLRTPRPVVLRASFQDDATFGDPVGLTRAVNAALREASVRGERPPLVYVDAEGYPEAFRLAGRYAVSGGVARVEARLIRGAEVAASVTAEGPADDPAALAAALVEAAEAALPTE